MDNVGIAIIDHPFGHGRHTNYLFIITHMIPFISACEVGTFMNPTWFFAGRTGTMVGIRKVTLMQMRRGVPAPPSSLRSSEPVQKGRFCGPGGSGTAPQRGGRFFEGNALEDDPNGLGVAGE